MIKIKKGQKPSQTVQDQIQDTLLEEQALIEGNPEVQEEVQEEEPKAETPQETRKWSIPKTLGEKLELVTDRPITYFDKRDLEGKGTRMGVGSRITLQLLDMTVKDDTLVRIKKGDCKRTFYTTFTLLNGMLDPQ